MLSEWQALSPFLGLVALVVCVFASFIGRRLGVMDVPDFRRKLHAAPTPLVGGLGVALAAVIYCVGAAALGGAPRLHLALAGITAAFFTLGYVDDRRHVKPRYRLLAAAAMAAAAMVAVDALVLHGLSFTLLARPWSFGIAAWGMTILMLVGLVNACNMVDGVNGLVAGLFLVWTALLALAGPPAEVTPLLGVLGVALGISLVFNLRGRVFMGDSGVYSLAALIGFLTIYTYNQSGGRLAADTVLIWFLVPVADCLRLIATRMIAGRSPFAADRHHLHHLLARILPDYLLLSVYLFLVAVPGVLATVRPDQNGKWLVLVAAAYGVALAVGGRRPVPSPRALRPDQGD